MTCSMSVKTGGGVKRGAGTLYGRRLAYTYSFKDVTRLVSDRLSNTVVS